MRTYGAVSVFIIMTLIVFILTVVVVIALGPYPGWAIEGQDASGLLGAMIGVFAAPAVGLVAAVSYYVWYGLACGRSSGPRIVLPRRRAVDGP